MRRRFTQHILQRAGRSQLQPSACLPGLQLSGLARQGLLAGHRHYQTGLQEVEPWPYAASAIEEAATPPASWYTSPAVLQAELSTVFQKSWLVCRHHAAAVCDEAHGNATQFACPYHGWTYGLDGRLQKATKLKGIKNFKASEMGLLPVPIDTWQGFAFIQPGKQRTTSLTEWLGKGGDAMKAAQISLANMKHVKTQHYQINCNWKVFCDNYLDGGYHVPFAHKGLASGLHLDSYQSSLYERTSIQSCPPQQASSEADQRLGEQSAEYAFVYPNLMLNRYGPWLDINIVEATGPQTCRVRFEYFLHQGHEAEEEFVEESLQASDAVQQEDVRLCEAVQRGLRSPAYDSGRYAPSVERPMFHFHQLLHQDLLQ